MRIRPSLVILAIACSGAACSTAESYDVVIANGRVMDPETGFFETANVGVRDGVVAIISAEVLDGVRVIDASGHVVAPGFVDLHEHGQNEESYALMVRDGVTTALELEVGTSDIARWYAERDGGQIVNHGVSIGHVQVRMDVMDDPGTGLVPAGIGGYGSATPEQLDEIERLVRLGLDQGALAVGFGSAYTPGADMREIQRLFAAGAEYGAPSHIHMRGGLAGLDSTLTAARVENAPLHIVHVNSSSGAAIEDFLSAIESAQATGQDVTTETYPYGAGMTEITSALFDDWASWDDDRFAMHQLVSTGERLNRASFQAARESGGLVIIHGRTEEMTRTAVASPITMIASDGGMENGRGHPRTSGSYAKVLGRYVRDEGLLTLEEAVAKMTIMPARRLEARAPMLARKGRLQVGMDADITVFDPETVLDRSTYMDATIPSSGIPFVLVNGAIVVDDGQVTTARPGRAVRAPTRQSGTAIRRGRPGA